MTLSRPICFKPLIKRALWGGTRLERELEKATGGVLDASESWEVCDLPGSVSVVSDGPLAGMTLSEVMKQFGNELVGRTKKSDQFPLLVKFLDAQHRLSVQVHPKNPSIMPDGTLRQGKAECCIILDAGPESLMFSGLRAGVDERQLRLAIETGDFDSCLYSFHPQPGDCIFLDAGTVHALGEGLLVAEIQQPSDLTYRLHDWGRVDLHGKPRELHIERSIAATDFQRGPVYPVIPKPLVERLGSELLVECPHFVIHRHAGSAPLALPDDDKMHVFIVISGEVSQDGLTLRQGQTAVIPAARASGNWNATAATVVIDSFLPG